MTRCKSCGKPLCGCSDPEYQGVIDRTRRTTRALLFDLRRNLSSLPATTTAASLGNGRDDLGGGVRHAAPASLWGAPK